MAKAAIERPLTAGRANSSRCLGDPTRKIGRAPEQLDKIKFKVTLPPQ
jgi:hypothetical protein